MPPIDGPISTGPNYQGPTKNEMKLNEMKCITTPFLSGLCYGPVLAGFYDPWTFVGMCL